jgi:ubiquinone/menaquinone biosynthesis C-methylase UbiE
MEDEGRIEFIRNVFNTVCEQYGTGSLRFFENAASHLPDMVSLRGDEHVLDIATGTGLASTLFAELLPEGQVTAIDISEGMLEKAQQRADSFGLTNINFQQMDMTSMQLPEEHFDIINASFAVFFVEDMENLVQHVASRLKPGGHFITTHFASGSMAPMQDLILHRLQLYGVDVPEISWAQLDNEASNRELYEASGFKHIRHKRNQVGYLFSDANDWWDVVWWAGYRGFVNQVPGHLAEQFKQEHLDEINDLANEEGIFFNVEVIHTIGEKA